MTIKRSTAILVVCLAAGGGPALAANPLANLTVRPATSSIAVPTGHSTTIPSGTFKIVLVNMSDTTFDVVAMKASGKDYTSYFTIPSVRPTCASSSFDACVDAKHYRVLFSVPCKGPSFDLFVGTRTAQGKLKGAEWPGIQPDCDADGGIVGAKAE